MRQGTHTMPVGNILVGNSGCDIKHDDAGLSVDVVSIPETTKLLLTCSIPNIESDLTQVLYSHQYDCSVRKRGVFHTVVKPRGCTSTPKVAIYFFSNSPVK